MSGKRSSWIIGLFTLLMLLLGEQWLETELNSNHQVEQRLDIYAQVNTLAARIQGTVASNLALVNGLSSAMGISAELPQKQFEFIARKLLQHPNQLRNMAIAPDLVIRYVYPLEGNEAALGLNYMEHPRQRAAAMLARDSRSMVLSGPYELVQGGTALIGRIPYYRRDSTEGDSFAGLVSAVIDMEALFEHVGIDAIHEHLDLTIISRSDLGDEDKVVLGRREMLAHNPVIASAYFSPASHWIIAAQPVGGWVQTSPLLPLTRQVFVLIALFLSWLIFYRHQMTYRLLEANRSLEHEVEQRRNAELQLLQSEARYRDISQSMADWIWEVDADGRYVFASGNVKDTLGYEPDELIGKSPFDFMPHDEAQRVATLFSDHVAQRAPITDIENWNINRDGERVCLLTNGVPVFDANGVFQGYRGIDKDITRQKRDDERLQQQQEELQLKQQQLEGLIENAPAIVYLKDTSGKYQMVNKRYADLMGMPASWFIGKTDRELHPGEVAERLINNDAYVTDHHEAIRREEELYLDDKRHIYETIKFPLFDTTGKVVALCGISTDITARKQNEENLQLFRKVVESANEAVVVTGLDGVITHINPAYETITGFNREEVLGKTPAIIRSGRQNEEFYREMWRRIIEHGHWEGEIWDRRKNGELFPKWLSINTVYDSEGEPSYHVGIFSDITDKKKTEEKLVNLAYYDPVTQLANRSLFFERLEHEISFSKRSGKKLAVLFIDLDRFKNINDTFGHTAGDELLINMAGRICSAVRKSDTVARLGGDEFTVILSQLDSMDDASRVATAITEMLYEPVTIQQNEIRVGGSIGIALYPEDGADSDTLSKKADMAMYQAKSHGRNTYQFFSLEMNQHLAERVTLEGELHHALENSDFRVYYQPKYRFEDEKLSGMEALLRWQHPEKGLISPDNFIPIAEESGLILPIGNMLFEETCRQIANWQEIYCEPFHVAINLSAKQFRHSNLIRFFEEVLEQTGVAPERLEIEITESTIVTDTETAIETMQRLRDIGLNLAIDDFGTGYSSLNYLKRFPLTTLKIDRSFIQDVTVNANDAAIVSAIIAMAHSLELKVVAEGVETREQLAFLRERGCHEAQGYLFSPAVTAETITRQVLRNCSADSV